MAPKEPTLPPSSPPRDYRQPGGAGFAEKLDALIRKLRTLVVRLAIVVAILAVLHVAASLPLYFLSRTPVDAPPGPLARELEDAWAKTQSNKEAIYAALRENGTYERDKRTVDAHVAAWQRHFFDPMYAFVMHEYADHAWYQAVLRIIGGIDVAPDSWVRFQKTQTIVPWGPYDADLTLPNGMTLKAFTEAIGEKWETPQFYSTWFSDGGADRMFGTGLGNDAELWRRVGKLPQSKP